jgi:phage terminase large subunit GpA-like protein
MAAGDAPPTAPPRVRTPEETRRDIMDAAVAEFSETRATAEGQNPRTIGFRHFGALLVPGWLSLAQIARDWAAAQRKPENIETFKNTVLGKPWQEQGEAPDFEAPGRAPRGFRHGRGAHRSAGPDRRRRRAGRSYRVRHLRLGGERHLLARRPRGDPR